MRRASVVLGVALLAALTIGVVGAQAAPPTQEPDPEDVLRRAEEALERADAVLALAQSAAEQSGAMLSFIQTAVTVGGVVVALAAAALTAANVRTLADYRRDLDQLVKNLETATQEAETARQTVQQEHGQAITALRERADRAIRALSLLQLGENQFRTGNYDEALATYLEAYRLDEDSQSVNYLLGELYLIARDLEKAIMHLDCALQMDANFAPALAAKGYAIRLQADAAGAAARRDALYGEAESHLLRALSMRPRLRNAEGEAVYGTLGGLYRRQGRLHEAIAAYERAVRVTPQHSYPVVNLAILHAMLGQTEQARQHFERTRSLAERKLDDNPFDFWARLDLASAYLNTGETDLALDTYTQAVEQVPTRGPLESSLDTLNDLLGAPTPPPGVEQAIALLEEAVARMENQGSG